MEEQEIVALKRKMAKIHKNIHHIRKKLKDAVQQNRQNEITYYTLELDNAKDSHSKISARLKNLKKKK